jgi:hypothetical protein
MRMTKQDVAAMLAGVFIVVALVILGDIVITIMQLLTN